MCVVTDGYNYERVIIFGGIQNNVVPELQSEDPEQEPNDSGHKKIVSALTNKCYLLELKQRPKD